MEIKTFSDHTRIDSHWRIVSHTEFDIHVRECSQLHTALVCSCGTTVRVWTDDSILMDDIKALNLLASVDDVVDAELYYVSCREVESVEIDDGEMLRVFCCGGRHYGRLKSLISSIGSYCRETEFRHGFHASAFKIQGRGVVLAAPPGLGKSLVLAAHRHQIESIVTDDWCDVIIREGHKCIAEQVDRGMSFNEGDFAGAKVGRCARLCKCGWRRKYFIPLEEFGIPVVKCMGVQTLVLVTMGGDTVNEIDSAELFCHVVSTSPHTLFGDGRAPSGHEEKRLAFFENLLRAMHAGNLEVVILHVTNANEAVSRFGHLVESWNHNDVLRELLLKKAEIIRKNGCYSGASLRFVFPNVCFSSICRENRVVALDVFKALIRVSVPMKCFFVHGSTGRGYGKVAPNIFWNFPEKTGMCTWVVPNCRDDLDIVCVCNDEWKSYIEPIREILRSVVPSWIDVTLNLVGEEELLAEFKHPDSPAMRRVVLFNTPWVVYGEDYFTMLYETAVVNCTELDHAHEVDFKALMCLSSILEGRGICTFEFTEGELQAILPTFWRMKHENVHVGFPQRRAKLKR